MLLNPVVPLSPVIVKDTVVVLADWFVAIVTLTIWALVMFPLIASSTVAPLLVFARTVADNGVGESDGDSVAVASGFELGTNVSDGSVSSMIGTRVNQGSGKTGTTPVTSGLFIRG
jgi:hypothetical protein